MSPTTLLAIVIQQRFYHPLSPQLGLESVQVGLHCSRGVHEVTRLILWLFGPGVRSFLGLVKGVIAPSGSWCFLLCMGDREGGVLQMLGVVWCC
jgi:hypothetical protein